MKTLLLIDANSLIHRCFHALPPLTAPDGRATGALYGVARILLKLWREEKPEYVAALFDRPEPTFRKKEYEEYKAQRPEAPGELVSQLIEAHNLFPKFGVKTFELPGYEADDLIATFAEKFKKEKNMRIVILTGDLDALQLVADDTVVVRTFRKGISDTFVYNEDAVHARYGLAPQQLPDYKALIGDPSDNIPGIPGVGPKTAAAFLLKYKSLEAVSLHAKAEPKLKRNAENLKEKLLFTKHLVTLVSDAPIAGATLEELRIREDPLVKDYFQALGFTSLLKRLEGSHSAAKEKGVGRPPGLFQGSPPKAKRKDVVFVYEEPRGFVNVHAYTSDKPKVGFSLKSSLKTLWENHQELLPPYVDLGVAFWLLNSDAKTYTPEAVFRKELKTEWIPDEAHLALAFDLIRERLEAHGLRKPFYDIEMPLLPLLAEMERWGILTNRDTLARLEKKIGRHLAGLTEKIYGAVGEPFNINSTQQLSRILFEKLKVRTSPAKKTERGKLSTRAEVLEDLREAHPVIPLILEYREDFKIQTTYVKALQELIGTDDRIHTEFLQTGTATGRVSSQNPNVQNIPKESAWSQELRTAFEAPEGFTFLSFDYSQIDLRVLASVSGDERMQEAFQKGLDIHHTTAAKIFNVPLGDVSPEMRRVAKTLNFGLIYGMGASAFARTSGVSRASAAKFIQAYFNEFPGIKVWQERVRQEVRTHGFVETLTGRRRYLPGVMAGIPRFVAEAERAAINQPIQGLTADIVKFSMLAAKEVLLRKGWWGKKVKLLLLIHDELLFEVADDIMEAAARCIAEAMEKAYTLRVPLRVDTYCGKHWGAMTAFS